MNYINDNTVPTLCQYGGKDFTVGIAQYSCLYSAFEKVGIQDKTKFIYMKYGGHELVNFDTDNGLKAMRDLNYDILDFAKTYFTHLKVKVYLNFIQLILLMIPKQFYFLNY